MPLPSTSLPPAANSRVVVQPVVAVPGSVRLAVTDVVGPPTLTSRVAPPQPSRLSIGAASARTCASVGPDGGGGGTLACAPGRPGATATPPLDALAHITSSDSCVTGTPGVQSNP